MVGVLVGDQDAMERLRSATDLGQALADLAAAEAGINQDPRLVRLEVGAVASRTTAEDRQRCRHGSDLRRKVSAGQQVSPRSENPANLEFPLEILWDELKLLHRMAQGLHLSQKM